MKNRGIFIITIILLSSLYNIVYSQAHLSFGYNGVVHQDTVCYGDTLFISFWIINSGSTPLNDSIQLTCETYDDSGVFINMGSFGMFSSSSGSLNPGDSMFFSVYDIVLSQSYNIGDNIVVIWPASIGPSSSDTSYTSLHVISCLTSFENNIITSGISVYPTLVQSLINIRSKNKLINSFYIIDMNGRKVLSKSNLTCNHYVIDSKNFLSGLYAIIVKTEDEIFTHKIIIN
tara:strand:+ start:1459 stop:2151 length:693 start_codon:yes stop_codon:yes gene_type:complete